MHSPTILLAPRTAVEYSPRARSVTAARRWVRKVLQGWGCRALLEPAQVVATELASNVVRHAPTRFEVALLWSDRGLRIEVTDRAAGPVAVRHDGREAPNGRGLRLVELLTDDWGVDPRRNGKTVWAEWRVLSAQDR